MKTSLKYEENLVKDAENKVRHEIANNLKMLNIENEDIFFATGVRMKKTFLEEYEENLIKNAVDEAISEAVTNTENRVLKEIANKLKDLNINHEAIFKATGIKFKN